MKFDTVIFDWDGTLAMTLHHWLEGWKSELTAGGHNFSDRKIVTDFFYEHDKGQQKYPDINFANAMNNVRNHVEQALDYLPLYKGAKAAFAEVVKRDVQVALVTSSSRVLVEKGLHLHGLKNEFSSVLAGDDGYGHKPSAMPFNETLKRLDANPDRTLVIGDSAADILAAHAAKCKSCLFAPTENAVFQDINYLASLTPDYTIQFYNEFPDII